MRALTIALLLVTTVGVATLLAADKPQPKERVDVRKNLVIELPTKDLVKNTAALEEALKKVELDITKGKRIEAPTKLIVNGSDNVAVPIKADITKYDVVEFPTKKLVQNAVEAPAASGADGKNPKVTPGNVRWHASFEDACLASRASGKPVMLFQMMGNLDDHFC